ncbi:MULTISPECIES: hypothetical protein [Halolamina]|uniref:Uncharacterized protein n=3 Tax=Halolamina TaxID=1075397 RepID=A0A1I5WCD9_9EURY|nr:MULTISPECIES: hypothetical protein [Halolamina]NHX37992.1 hypothetical protein [Halolamina sp. R1-12]SFQ17348.1 hypothetical protein SAMN05216277_1275 [Halolamina pelagica]
MHTKAALGFDLALQIREESYEIEEDARGVAHAFALDDDTREQLESGVERAFDRGTVSSVDVQPGYLRARVEPGRPAEVSPADLVGALENVPKWYNQTHADGGERIIPGDTYVTVYLPDGATTPEEFVDTVTGDDRAPDADGPICSLSRDGDPSIMPDRYFSYHVVVPLDPEMYDAGNRHPFEWGEFERERFAELVVDDPVLWPGGVQSVRSLELHPEHVTVRLDLGNVVNTPESVCETVGEALDRYNRAPGVHPRLGKGGQQVLPPDLALGAPVYIGAVEPERTVDDWIATRELDAVDGEPIEPEPEPEEDGESGGLLSWGG